MSPRRVVIGVTLLAFVAGGAGGAGSAFADGLTRHHNELCVVLAQDDNGDVTKDFCITWPGPQQ